MPSAPPPSRLHDAGLGGQRQVQGPGSRAAAQHSPLAGKGCPRGAGPESSPHCRATRA